MQALRSLRVVALVVVIVALVATRAAAASVDYLYIESNEGGSSGGHVALRLGDRAYDFQHQSPGLLRLERRDADDLLYTYAFLQNRPVHVSRIDVSDDTYALLREHFNRLYLAQSAQYDALGLLEEDRRLFDALAHPLDPGPDGAEATLALPGAGYFFVASSGHAGFPLPTPTADPSPALLDLRRRAEQRFGPGWLERRIEAETKSLEALPPAVVPLSALPTDVNAYPRVDASFSSRYRDGRTALAALSALRLAAAPAAETLVTGDGPEFALSPSEVAALRAFASRLRDQLAQVPASQRPDWGFVLLVGMARLDALDRSIRSERLLVLDAYPANAPVLATDAISDTEARAGLTAEAAAELGQAKASLRQGTPIDEAAYNDIENAANRYHEWIAVGREGRGLRVVPDRLLPRREARFPLDIRPRAAAPLLRSVEAQAAFVRDAYARALHERDAYDLPTRNCVSELFANINAAMGGNAAVSRARLGGVIEPGSAAGVVPFLSAAAVNAHYRVSARLDLPSYRQQRIAALDAREGSTAVALRESNTLTSTVYRANAADSFFLLFADQPAWRPLAGAVNLLAGAAAATVGAATLPLRGSAPLMSGLRGMMFSLPELAFVQIRKGSFTYVDRRRARPPEWW